MTQTEVIKKIEKWIDEAYERRAYYDEKGQKELGWREHCFINGLSWALAEIKQIQSHERN